MRRVQFGRSDYITATQYTDSYYLPQSKPVSTTKQNDAAITLHGSSNLKQPTGYALIRVQFRNHQPVATVLYIDGWLQDDTAWRSPVDVIVGHDSCLYLSDDKTGWIYHVRSNLKLRKNL